MSNRKLDWRRKSIYATGDFTVNTALASLSMIYASYFLIEVAGLRPALAAMVPFVGRVVDANGPVVGRQNHAPSHVGHGVHHFFERAVLEPRMGQAPVSGLVVGQLLDHFHF